MNIALACLVALSLQPLDESIQVVTERYLSLESVTIDGVERERVVHLNGPVLEFIRKGHDLSCIHVGDTLVRLDHTIPAGPFAKKFGAGLGDLQEHYELALVGTARIADRQAVLIDVKPRDPFRFGYQLALDNESGLLLRSLLLDSQQRILERFQFAEVSIGGEPNVQGLQSSTVGHVVAHHLVGETHSQKGPSVAAAGAWQISWMPPGFMMAASDLQRGPIKGVSVGSQMYTDGLAVFSVFVEMVQDTDTQAGSARRGGTVAYTMPMVGNRQQVVTVVGEVPLTTARRVANSVVFNTLAGQ